MLKLSGVAALDVAEGRIRVDDANVAEVFESPDSKIRENEPL